ncbi:MAG: hypothetical protein HQK95_01605, partial [Nitrospirae bacterium]|nr:hypothetical protein [Nitrospirota bacterium]
MQNALKDRNHRQNVVAGIIALLNSDGIEVDDILSAVNSVIDDHSITCPGCGTRITNPEYRYCTKCRTHLGKYLTSCGDCKAEFHGTLPLVSEKSKFCSFCGSKNLIYPAD